MSRYLTMLVLLTLEQTTDDELATLKATGLDAMLLAGDFEETVIDGETKTPSEQVAMLKDAITAILTV